MPKVQCFCVPPKPANSKSTCFCLLLGPPVLRMPCFLGSFRLRSGSRAPGASRVRPRAFRGALFRMCGKTRCPRAPGTPDDGKNAYKWGVPGCGRLFAFFYERLGQSHGPEVRKPHVFTSRRASRFYKVQCFSVPFGPPVGPPIQKAGVFEAQQASRGSKSHVFSHLLGTKLGPRSSIARKPSGGV